MAAGFTYHMEALRKTQVLQRKHEAQARIREATAVSLLLFTDDDLLFISRLNYETVRFCSMVRCPTLTLDRYPTTMNWILVTNPRQMSKHCNYWVTIHTIEWTKGIYWRSLFIYFRHSDPAYRLIYPNSDNFDYLRDVNQKDRRRLCSEANYKAFRAVNFGCQPKMYDWVWVRAWRLLSLFGLFCYRFRFLLFNADHPVRHRKVDNTTLDRVSGILIHVPHVPSEHKQPRKRVPHFKV